MNSERTKEKPETPNIKLLLLLSLFTTPIILVMIIIFGLLRKTVGLILKIKHGINFGGLMQGGDIFWAIEDVTKCLINSIMIVEFNHNNPEKVCSTLREVVYKKCFENEDAYPKLSYLRHKFMGYHFFLKTRFTKEECVNVIDVKDSEDYLTELDLHKIVSSYGNKEMPRNHAGLWEISVLNKPIKWSPNCEKFEFVVMFRAHHSLGDGIALLKFISAYIADSQVEADNEKNFVDNILSKNETSWQIIGRTVETWFKNIYSCVVGPPIVIMKAISRKRNQNHVFGGKEISGNKLLVWATEKDAELVTMVKKTKNTLAGARFSDVILTAASASFSDYFDKKELTNSMEHITAISVFRMADTSEIVFNNTISMGRLNLPTSSNKTFPPIKRLQELILRNTVLRNSSEYVINYWLSTVISDILPEPLLRPLLNFNDTTVLISNLPGTKKLSAFNGVLNDVIFWVPNREKIGLGMSILTYDNRIQVGLIVDEALISNYEEAKSIVDGVLEHIPKIFSNVNEAINNYC